MSTLVVNKYIVMVVKGVMTLEREVQSRQSMIRVSDKYP